ncbi:MAG: ribonuclease Y [Parcubacteria group bacterium]|nr:ribonuclease Y [Parcubacteria group bacterium]
MTIIVAAIIAAASLVGGGAAGYAVRKSMVNRKKGNAEARVEKILSDAKNKGKEILLAAKDEALKVVDTAKREEKERRDKLIGLEENLSTREKNFDQRLNQLENKQKQLEGERNSIQKTKQELGEIRKKQIATLEKVAKLTQDKAKDVLLEMVEKDMKDDILARMNKLKKIGQEEADKKAQEIIAITIDRMAASQAAESTTTTISLPSDEMKGRIIGREGRNIKRIEEMTGAEIIVDDTPQAIVISGFSPVRRQIAKRALESLIADGRIHPTKIEEAINKAKQELGKEIKEAGEETVFDLGIADLEPKLVQLIGRLKFRTSFGQNVLLHSIEVANFAALIAEELGANVSLAKKAGLLHDIGKAVDHDVEGTHIEIGKTIMKKFGVSEDVIHAMECHHGDFEPQSVEAFIVKAADGISGARPGARKDTFEKYIKRLEDLENIANNMEGVEKTYAIQAGREIRVFVTPEKIDDLEAVKLAKKIAEQVEDELKYPGEIKVNVIRETRAIEYAR